MNKKTKNIVSFCAALLVGVVIGAFIAWQDIQIGHKNEEIASLKEELSQAQTDWFKNILKFGQWKLQVEKLAKENGWQLPEMNDSLLIITDTIPFEATISAEMVGDSLRVTNRSVKINDEKSVSEAE